MTGARLTAPPIGLPILGDAALAASTWDALSAHAADGGPADLVAWLRSAREDRAVRPLLDAALSNSPFLADCAARDVAFVREIVEAGPDTALTRVIARTKDDLAREPDRERLMRELRRSRRRVALLVGLADIAGHWPLDRVTQALSDFADGAISATLSHLLRDAGASGNLALADPEFPEDRCGYVVLAMGKHGARELNYSSDIDLIVLYEPLRIDYRGRRSVPQMLVRLTQALATILNERTADGYVFRVDLRLRPDPGSTPVAIPMGAAQSYYAGRGANWERAAMIKARPVAGDLELGQRFLESLQPFIWRSHLDFATVRDIEDMKRQIVAQRGGGEVAFLGHNIKLGRGGIREIEFFAQTHQLVFAGRDPYLRCQRTVEALSTLAEAGHIDAEVADELTEAYEFLRQLEHRLQMVDDQQTQTLPADEAAMARLAGFMAFDNMEAFRDVLLHHLHVVERHFSGFFGQRREERSAALPASLLDGPEEPAAEALAALGFRDAVAVAARLRSWGAAGFPANRHARCREQIDRLTGALAECAARTPDPDGAAERFEAFLRVLAANPRLLDLVVELQAAAPALAADLARIPSLLQAALAEHAFDTIDDRRMLAAEVASLVDRAPDLQDAVERAAAWAGEQRFRIAVAVLRRAIDPSAAGAGFTAVADAVVRALLVRLGRELGVGGVDEGPLVLASGRYGACSLSYRTPLDFLFVGRGDAAAEPETGRLARRLVALLGARTANGAPCAINTVAGFVGDRSPILTSLDALAQAISGRHEIPSLTPLARLRRVAGPQGLYDDLQGVVREAAGRLTAPPRPAEQAAAPPVTWEPAPLLGRFDCLVARLQLESALQHPEALEPSPLRALARLEAAGRLEPALGHRLQQSYQRLCQLDHVLDIAVHRPFDAGACPDTVREAVLKAVGVADEAALESRMRDAAATLDEASQAAAGSPG
jgi:glutamate-ammonia-ligase adenylyltransferase